MTNSQYEEYKKVESFKSKCVALKLEIEGISNQVSGGHSKIGYMREEVQEMKKELIQIIDKNIQLAEDLKEKI